MLLMAEPSLQRGFVVAKEMVEVMEHDLMQGLILQLQVARRHSRYPVQGVMLYSLRRDGYGVVVLEDRAPHEDVQERGAEEPEDRHGGSE